MESEPYWLLGHAAGCLIKSAGTPANAVVLTGRLYASASGWVLLSVPNALVRGLFDAMNVPGIELPPGPNGFNAHISVMNKEEVASIGGVDKITERGHQFHYQLGPMQEVVPDGWKDMSKVWFVRVYSKELSDLRRAYGLSALPDEGRKAFHCTVAVRRKHVLQENDVSKAAEAKPANCNCGWPEMRCRNGSGHAFACPVHQEWEAAGGFGQRKQATNEVIAALAALCPQD